ncbi:nucleotidyltransferase [Lachnoclostridium sp. An196]|uniref:nucleotidyltransferase family protein n=1 Tax=Lachnoclostridium sp. An196 TaxID=1965583 RepID=UPI000B3667CC|nr:sugar phosphate nucleotidyltransferase [Lachnoclostridium sp. An196]OUP22299.1 nucleotidyltransferase [Lachnoclostridium sp. An196]
MRKTTLVVMAAGIGSRFGGGIKQLEPVGPSGEIIMDYSVYDAIQAGFDKVVFIIRKDLEKDFREIIGNRMEKIVETAYAFQELDDLPAGFQRPEGRTKPWGTGQAILCCKDLVQEPFAVINADDYYGKEAFVKVHDYLAGEHPACGKMDFCMAGFQLGNTLSENGGVTRGICSVNEDGHLTKVTETKNIVKTPEGAAVKGEDGRLTSVAADCPVSMNMWGFTPEIFEVLENGFAEFLKNLSDPMKGEYLIPTIVDGLIQEQKANVTVLESRDKWFGVTYKEDKPAVVRSFRELIDAGVYREKLFG